MTWSLLFFRARAHIHRHTNSIQVLKHFDVSGTRSLQINYALYHLLSFRSLSVQTGTYSVHGVLIIIVSNYIAAIQVSSWIVQRLSSIYWHMTVKAGGLSQINSLCF